MTKIETSFEYQSEQAKLSFQNNLSSLLEIEKLLSEKSREAKTPHVCFTNDQVQIISKWILETVTHLSGDYLILNRTNNLLNANNKILEGLLHRKTPDLKTLLKA